MSLVTIAAGVAVAEGIEAATGLGPSLKWPNDVYVGSRKLAGILAEAGASQGAVDHVVLGFGINIRRAVYPADVEARATSIESELGRTVDGDSCWLNVWRHCPLGTPCFKGAAPQM